MRLLKTNLKKGFLKFVFFTVFLAIISLPASTGTVGVGPGTSQAEMSEQENRPVYFFKLNK